jgi:hypothetical protein
MNQDANTQIALNDPRVARVNKLVHVATEMGFDIVQEIAAQAVKRKPGMSVKEFTKVLDDYLVQQKAQANSNG